jgi:hypothetical protein
VDQDGLKNQASQLLRVTDGETEHATEEKRLIRTHRMIGREGVFQELRFINEGTFRVWEHHNVDRLTRIARPTARSLGLWSWNYSTGYSIGQATSAPRPDEPFAISGLEILFPSKSVIFIKRCFVVDEPQRPALTSRWNLSADMLSETPFQIVGAAGVEISIRFRDQDIHVMHQARSIEMKLLLDP